MPELRVPTERITSDVKMVHLWDVAKNAQAEQKGSYSHRKHTKVSMIKGINPKTTENKV